jgi:hypothetical protein
MEGTQRPLKRSPVTGCSEDAMAGQSKQNVSVEVENGKSVKTHHFLLIPLVGINSPVVTVVPPYVNLEEPLTTCHSIVANSANLSSSSVRKIILTDDERK